MIQDRTQVRLPHRKIKTLKGEGEFRISDGETIKITSLTLTTAKNDPRVSIEIWDDAYPLPVRLYFAHLDPIDDGPLAPLVGVEIGSEERPTTELTRTQLGHLVRQLPLYVEYARAEMQIYGDPSRIDSLLDVLNAVGMTRRGKPLRFYRVIGDEYNARVRAGDPAPVTSIATAHGVNKSTASRWVKMAKRLQTARTHAAGPNPEESV